MPPRVTYWTGTWDPAREAISKEIAALRSASSVSAPVVSFSPGQRSSLLRQDHVLRLSAQRWITLRACAFLVERWGDVTHVFGGLQSWHLLRAVGRRPVLLTVALPGPAADPRLYEKVAVFAAESVAVARALSVAGVSRDRIEVVYPGVDTGQFKPAPLPPPKPFRVLFASSPADAGEFEARGIPVLIDAARRCPEAEFVLLWRAWGNRPAADRALSDLAPPPNVTLVRRDVRDMPAVYNTVHAVACCYADGFGKTAPNSVLEGLACGRPALLSEGCGIADLIGERGAGVVVRRDPESVTAGIRALQADLPRYSAAARRLAVDVFDVRDFRRRYAHLHDRLAAAGLKDPKDARSALDADIREADGTS